MFILFAKPTKEYSSVGRGSSLKKNEISNK